MKDKTKDICLKCKHWYSDMCNESGPLKPIDESTLELTFCQYYIQSKSYSISKIQINNKEVI